MKILAHIGTGTALLAALAISTPLARATPVEVYLGVSAQDYTLIGTGLVGGNATYINDQGACTAGASFTTCILSGTYTGTYAGFTDGTYSLVTTYANGSPIESTSETSDPNYFEITSLGSDTSVYLDLTETGGTTSDVPIIVDSTQISTSNYNLDGATPSCGGTPLGGLPCTQFNVGTVPGATYSGPVSGTSVFDTDTITSVTPEPSPFILLGTAMLALAGYGALRRYRIADLFSRTS
ncbi:MAG: hypothetical protein WBY53_15585 [Acidobacteriaceae bacterium]